MKTICFNVRRPVGVVWIVILVFAVLYGVPGRACTTALWGFGATGDGAPMLWKNRDTDILSNKAVYVAAQPLPYLGLIDAGDPSRQVWAGVNEAGLAIFNSVAYNLPMQPQDAKDQEGFINSYAFMERLNAFFKPDQIVTTDMGALAAPV